MTPTLAETIFCAIMPFVLIAITIVHNVKKQRQENEQIFGWTTKEKRIYKEMGRI